MEDNQNAGVDFSNYLSNTKKKVVTRGLSDEDKAKKKNKVYIIIITCCILTMVALWTYYLTRG